MLFKTIESWIRSKSIFEKGFAISGIVIILVVFLDLMINRSLINQYIIVLSYIFAAVSTLISTDYILQLALNSENGDQDLFESHNGIFGRILEHVVSYGRNWLDKNNRIRELYERYHLLKLKGQTKTSVRYTESKTSNIRSEDEVDEFVSAISNGYVRTWTETICNTSQAERHSRETKHNPTQYETSNDIFHCDDLAGDIENELRFFLSSILSKIRSVDKMTLTNDILGVTRCHLKRLCHAFVRSNKTSNFVVNAEELIASFQFRHHVQTNKQTKKNNVSSCQEIMNETLSRIDYFENSARRLLSIFGLRKNYASLNSVIIQKFLIQIIAHQLILKMVDAMSDPGFIQHYILKMYSSLSLPIDTKYISRHKDTSPNQPKSNNSNFKETEKQIKACEASDVDDIKVSSGGHEKQNNVECPEVIDLTGYKVGGSLQRKEMDDETAKAHYPERNNLGRGSGKITQALGGLVSFSAGPLLPSNLAFKQFNKMWGSPLHQNRFKTSMKNNGKHEDYVTKNNVENGLDELKNDADTLSFINLRKHSAQFLRDKFRKHRFSLPNSNSMDFSVAEENIGISGKAVNNEKIYVFTNNNNIALSNQLSDEISDLNPPNLKENHLNNETTQGRLSRTRGNRRSFGSSLKFPWSKGLVSSSLPSSPMKTQQNQQLLDCVIRQMKDYSDPHENHLNLPLNNEKNDVLTISQMESLGTSVTSIKEETTPYFDIGESIQSQKGQTSKEHDLNEDIEDSRLESMPSNVSDVENSLVFEDNEDLESTIRKLRQLLSQTKSDDNSSGDSNVHPIDEKDPPLINVTEASQNPLPYHNTNGEILSLISKQDNYVDEPDAALDGRLFYNICVTDVDITETPKKTRQTKDSPRLSLSQDDNHLVDASSLVFSISYDGMYIEEVLPQIDNDNNAEFARSPLNKHPQTNSFKYTLEKEQVKRKYQEFVILQKHIENKISVDSDIWSLKENSTKDKILEKFHNKFGNQKSSFNLNEMVDVQERKEYLEKWLIEICGNSALCHTPELKEFLSYPVDDSFVVARKSFRNARNDKRFFARKMTGMINSIKEAFPNFEEDHLDVFSSLNSYQSDAKFHTEESSNAPLPKTSRLSLLPDFFSSSTSASPSHSPMIEKPNYSMGEVTPTDEASCRKIGFKFSADEKQKSEFETLVEFQIQHQEEKVMKKHFDAVRNTLKRENDKNKCQKSLRKQLNVNPTDENISIDGHLSSSLLECILVDLIPMLPMRPEGSFDWLSKDIAVQLVKKMLVDPLNSVCQAMIQLLDCDDKWRYYLSSLRQNLFPNVASCENIKLEINGDKASFFSTASLFKDVLATEENQTFIQDTLKAFNIDPLELHKFLLQITASKEINEDYMFCLCDVFLARLLD